MAEQKEVLDKVEQNKSEIREFIDYVAKFEREDMSAMEDFAGKRILAYIKEEL